jgi:hypothetical protein
MLRLRCCCSRIEYQQCCDSHERQDSQHLLLPLILPRRSENRSEDNSRTQHHAAKDPIPGLQTAHWVAAYRALRMRCQMVPPSFFQPR